VEQQEAERPHEVPCRPEYPVQQEYLIMREQGIINMEEPNIEHEERTRRSVRERNGDRYSKLAGMR
jgi:hypothetical protein